MTGRAAGDAIVAKTEASRLVQALRGLGLDSAQIDGFLRNETIVYRLSTQGDPGIAMIERVGDRLRSGVIEINDPGGGRKDFMQFRARSRVVAVELGVVELEWFAAAVIYEKLEHLLRRQGFRSFNVAVPEDLGGGMMTILSKLFAVP